MYWHFSFVGLFFICYVLAKVNKNQFAETKSILWITGGILMLLLSLFPVIFTRLSTLLDVAYPPSLLFLLSILFVVFVTFRQDQEISLLSEQVKDLAQRNALLEKALTRFKCDRINDCSDLYPRGVRGDKYQYKSTFTDATDLGESIIRGLKP